MEVERKAYCSVDASKLLRRCVGQSLVAVVVVHIEIGGVRRASLLADADEAHSIGLGAIVAHELEEDVRAQAEAGDDDDEQEE